MLDCSRVVEFDIFLSHATSDEAWVRALVDALGRRDVKVWLSQERLRGGDLLVSGLEDAISRSGAMAVVLSDASVKSKWVTEEYQAAIAESHARPDFRVIPCRISDCAIPRVLHNRVAIDFSARESFEARVDDLYRAIKDVAPKPAAPVSIVLERGPVGDAGIGLLDVCISNRRRKVTEATAALACSPLVGLAAALVSPRVDDLPWTTQYLGAPLFVGLVAVALWNRRWSATRAELNECRHYREALRVCQAEPRPLCSRIAEGAGALVKRLLHIE